MSCVSVSHHVCYAFSHSTTLILFVLHTHTIFKTYYYTIHKIFLHTSLFKDSSNNFGMAAVRWRVALLLAVFAATQLVDIHAQTTTTNATTDPSEGTALFLSLSFFLVASPFLPFSFPKKFWNQKVKIKDGLLMLLYQFWISFTVLDFLCFIVKLDCKNNYISLFW